MIDRPIASGGGFQKVGSEDFNGVPHQIYKSGNGGLIVKFFKAGSHEYAKVFIHSIPGSPLMNLSDKPILSRKAVLNAMDDLEQKFDFNQIKDRDEAQQFHQQLNKLASQARVDAQIQPVGSVENVAPKKTTKLAIKRLFASAGATNGESSIKGMISKFYGGSNISLKSDDGLNFEIHNSKGKISGVAVVLKGKRYQFGQIE